RELRRYAEGAGQPPGEGETALDARLRSHGDRRRSRRRCRRAACGRLRHCSAGWRRRRICAKGRVASAARAEAASTPRRHAWRGAVLEITANAGVDVVFDPVGGDAFDQAVRTVGWDGRYLVIGFAAGRIPELKVNHPLVKGYEIIGVRYDVWRDRFWPDARAN